MVSATAPDLCPPSVSTGSCSTIFYSTGAEFRLFLLPILTGQFLLRCNLYLSFLLSACRPFQAWAGCGCLRLHFPRLLLCNINIAGCLPLVFDTATLGMFDTQYYTQKTTVVCDLLPFTSVLRTSIPRCGKSSPSRTIRR